MAKNISGVFRIAAYSGMICQHCRKQRIGDHDESGKCLWGPTTFEVFHCDRCNNELGIHYINYPSPVTCQFCLIEDGAYLDEKL
jgi:hypothetical protein